MGADRLQRCHPGAWKYLDKYYTGIEDNRIIDLPKKRLVQIPNNQFSISNENSQLPNTESRQSISNTDFADYLFDNKDYARAIGEYKKIYFSTADESEKDYCNLMLGEAYLETHAFDQAFESFAKTNTPYRQYGQARVMLKIERYDKARQKLDEFNDDGLQLQKIILTGVSYLKQGDYKSGSMFLKEHSTLDNNDINELARFNGTQISHKNRALAIGLSVIIPGAGQIYSSRFSDGLYSFLTVTTCGLVSSYYWKKDNSKIKFSIFAALTAFFYAGNVYGASVAARDYNNYQSNNYQQKIDRVFRAVKIIPDYRIRYQKTKGER